MTRSTASLLTYFQHSARRLTAQTVSLANHKFRIYRSLSRMAKTKAPYGAWKSPVTSAMATESSVSFQEVHTDKQKPGLVFWSEMRFDEGGRYVVCSCDASNNIVEWTPKNFNARTRVHEYGGGSFLANNGEVYFTNFSDQRLYHQKDSKSAPQPISAENSGQRFADFHINSKTGIIYCVREDHSEVGKGERKEAENTVVAINPKTNNQSVLASGCDFYSNPRVSPDGKRICWVQWNHPNMPWYATEICRADLSESGAEVLTNSVVKVAGGDGSSFMHPNWLTNQDVAYIGDQTDWWNIYHVNLENPQKHQNLREVNEEAGGPAWVFGLSSYAQNPTNENQLVTTHKGKMGLLDVASKAYKEIKTGYDAHSFINFGPDGNVYCVCSGPSQFPFVARIDPASGKSTVLRESRKTSLDADYLSIPKEISWTSGNDETSYGFFYPPKSKDFVGVDGTKPPLLVKVHGGPTAFSSNTLNLRTVQYWTTRGFAILDVNYRGSTGYGAKYRKALNKRWGICDVEDCATGAKHLGDIGEVNGDQLCIDGGSAGGYTTLAALAFTDVFKAGVSHYGVCDLGALAKETHKFESRYLDVLLGPYPEAIDVYNERSPINHIDKFTCPIAFFHGDEDEIVPPNQAEMMYNAVKAKGLMSEFVLFKGEQHGFRKAENAQKAMDGEYAFYKKVFGF